MHIVILASLIIKLVLQTTIQTHSVDQSQKLVLLNCNQLTSCLAMLNVPTLAQQKTISRKHLISGTTYWTLQLVNACLPILLAIWQMHLHSSRNALSKISVKLALNLEANCLRDLKCTAVQRCKVLFRFLFYVSKWCLVTYV